jgi:hypothetical protein
MTPKAGRPATAAGESRAAPIGQFPPIEVLFKTGPSSKGRDTKSPAAKSFLFQ